MKITRTIVKKKSLNKLMMVIIVWKMMKMVRVKMVMSVVDVSTLYGSVERTTFLSYFPGSGQGEAAGSSGEQGRWVWVGGVADQCSDKGGGGVCQDGEGHVGGRRCTVCRGRV